MRFGTIGTGILGGLFAGHLDANGEDVCCFDVDETVVAAIDERGLRVECPGTDDLRVHPDASTDAADLGVVDVAFVMTKAIDTGTAIVDASPMIGDETRVVTVQNGLRNVEIIGRHVPERRVLGECTHAGGNAIGPGHVRQSLDGETVVGGADLETADAVATRLTSAGVPTMAVPDPEPHIWEKQFTNVAIKPLAPLTGLRNGPMIDYEETRAVMRRLIKEAIAVARARGIEIRTDYPVAKVIDRDLDPAGRTKKSSILEDVENGRPTEIEHINGAVVAYGEDLGVDTPYNRMATRLMYGKERSYLE